MKAIRELMRLEPVRVRAVIGALFGLAIAFGIDVSPENQGTILALLDALLPILLTVLIAATARDLVRPVAKES